MNKEELRIGNLVSRFNKDISVTEILTLWIDSDYSPYGYIEYNKLKPILLTEDWLIKLGFEKDKTVSYFYNKGLLTISTPSELNKPKGRVYFNSWAILEEMPKSVHQLQNLYFALTGEELTIIVPH